MNDYIFKVRTDGDIIDLEGRVIGHINLEYIKSIAERPQGEWITDYTAKQKRVVACNKCNCISIQGKSNFCPNCGADMREGDSE